MRLRLLFAGSVFAAALTVGCAHNPCGCARPAPVRPCCPPGGTVVPAAPVVPGVPAAPVPVAPSASSFGVSTSVPNGCACH
jgi:hypothetical protein